MENAATPSQVDDSQQPAALEEQTPEECRILGVYSLHRDTRTGLGLTGKDHAQEILWFVRRMNDEDYCVQPLNANSIPSGPIATITKGEFVRHYQPKPGYYEKRCLPFIESLKRKIVQAGKCLDINDLEGAEKEFLKALLLDAQHPRANIELGKIYLQKRDGRKLTTALRRILGIDALFQEQERHLFNEFAICLRKQKRYAEALSFYEKAISRNIKDEHLQFNIARALAESGDIPAARRHLEKALSLRPDFLAARRFLTHLDTAGPETGTASATGTSVFPTNAAARGETRL